VLPKERKLVEPGALDAAAGEWPNDPDEIKRRKKLEEASITNEFFGSKSIAPVSPDELRSTGYAVDDPADMQAIEEYNRRASNPLKPDVLRSQKLRGLAQDTPMIPGQEPPRKSLTDPPPGIRTPVASAPLDDTIELPSEAAAKAKAAEEAIDVSEIRTKLSAKELEGYREVLLRSRMELVGRVDSLEDEALRSSGGNLSNMPLHMADVGTDTFDQEFALNMAASDREKLAEIDAALQRIADRTYGVCQITGKPIPKARLDANPLAKYTVEAARLVERGVAR